MIGLGVGLSMRSIGAFFVYMTLGGLGSGPAFSTNETSIVDIMFLHQRATWIAVWSLVLMLGNFLPPVAAGYIVDSQGWTWCLIYLLIFLGLATLLLISTGEETLYVRDVRGLTPVESHVSAQRPTEPTQVSPDAKSPASEAPTRFTHHVSSTYELLPYISRLTLFRRNSSIKVSYFALILQPFRLMMLPAVVWAGFMVALGSFLTSIVFTTQAYFFSAPPYNFPPATLGLMYFALIIGMIIGTAWGGPFGDWFVLFLARRNGGILEPEQRLWVYLPVSLASAAGVLLYGVGASYGLHWIVSCIGLALMGFAIDAALPVAMGYALDCYDDLSGEIVQLTSFIRNAVAGALTFIIQPWVNYNGPRNTSIIIAMLLLVLNLSSIVFQIWGKRIRVKTKPVYRKLVEQKVYA